MSRLICRHTNAEHKRYDGSNSVFQTVTYYGRKIITYYRYFFLYPSVLLNLILTISIRQHFRVKFIS